MVKQRKYIFRLIGILFFLFWSSGLAAQSPIPGINISVNPADNPEQVATTLQIVFLLTVLTLAPALLIMTTSFTRFIYWFIVFIINNNSWIPLSKIILFSDSTISL